MKNDGQIILFYYAFLFILEVLGGPFDDQLEPTEPLKYSYLI